jgi:hypothetical protein
MDIFAATTGGVRARDFIGNDAAPGEWSLKKQETEKIVVKVVAPLPDRFRLSK